MNKIPKLAQAIDDYIGAAKSLSKEGYNTAWIEPTYRTLQELYTQPPLTPISFSETSQAVQNAPEAVRIIMEKAAEAFAWPESGSLFNMQQPLDELANLCRNKPLPISALLTNVAEKWLQALTLLQWQEQKPTLLRIGLSPSLNLEYIEEWKSVESGVRRINLPIALTNTGQLPVANLKIFFALDKANLDTEDTGEGFERSADGWWTAKLKIPSIAPGDTIVSAIPLVYMKEAHVHVRVEYQDIQTPRASKQTSQSFRLLVPSDTDVASIQNIYTPDVYLTSESGLMRGNHPQIVKDILADARLAVGRIYVVRGLKRTGKTSILRDIEEQMGQGDSYLPVYIDIYLWWHILRAKGESIDGENLWYEIADTITRQVAKKDIDTTPLDDYLRPFEDSMRMRYSEFADFIGTTSQFIGRHLVLLLDELDFWIRAKEFEKDAQTLLLPLSTLAREGRCSVILAHEWADQEWESRYLEAKVPPIYKRIAFLTLDDVRSLAEVAGVPYTELALEYTWRVTGGWPGIVQLVLFRLIEKVTSLPNTPGSSKHPVLIDIALVKKVVERMLRSPDDQPFFRYFLDSLTQPEIALLQALVDQKLLRSETGQIIKLTRVPGKGFLVEEPIQWDQRIADPGIVLKALAGKQILEPNSPEQGRHRLRVGLLSYPAVLKLYQNDEMDQ